MEIGPEVKARTSDWNDLFQEMGTIERAAVKTVNFIYFPAMRFEERTHQSKSQQ